MGLLTLEQQLALAAIAVQKHREATGPVMEDHGPPEDSWDDYTAEEEERPMASAIVLAHTDLTVLSMDEFLVAAEMSTRAKVGNEVQSLKATLRQLDTLRGKLEGQRANPQYARHIPGTEMKIQEAETKAEGLREAITQKIYTMRDVPAEEEKPGRATTQRDNDVIQGAKGIIRNIAEFDVDVVPQHLLQMGIPEVYESYLSSRGIWYRQLSGGRLELVNEDEVAEDVQKALMDQNYGRIVGTALEMAKIEPDTVPVSVVPVLRTWASHMRSYKTIYEYLPSDDSLVVRDDLLPVELIDAHGEVVQTAILHRKTGTWSDNPPDGVRVLYPAVRMAPQGESRALDAMVAHHFKTQEEVDAFYTTCGISLFGYGVPNLVFLFGQGGSGKDMLFAMMRAVHSDRLVCTLQSEALTGNNESNDFVRLQNARFALCSFESSHYADGGFKPATLKSITSGGVNPITARAKYARQAVDIHYRGSLWLYGNRVPNLTGGGDFDGLDRRFMILPMTKPLPKAAKPPAGFNSWSDAVVACAPVFAHRCAEAFITWHQGGAVGYSDVRRRIPKDWRELSEIALFSGSRFGFLREIFLSDSTMGTQDSTIYEVMGAIVKDNHMRLSRTKFLDTLRDTLPRDAHFEDGKFMEPDADRFHGEAILPLTVDLDAVKRYVSAETYNQIHTVLKADGHWSKVHADRIKASSRTPIVLALLRGDDSDA